LAAVTVPSGANAGFSVGIFSGFALPGSECAQAKDYRNTSRSRASVADDSVE